MKYEDVVRKAKEDIKKRANYGNGKILFVPCPIWEAGN